MSNKHTPAPWTILEMPDRLIIKNEELNLPIGDVYGIKAMTLYNKDQVRANAKLIASAPELLEALRFCQSVIQSQGMFDLSEKMAYDKADAAIKKATE